ncbi:MAG: sensor histidine kinase [Acidimicrobiales bacterium]
MFQQDELVPDRLQELCHDIANPAVTVRLLAEAITLEPGLGRAMVERLEGIVREARVIEEICGYFLEGLSEAQDSARLDLVVGDLVRSARLVYGGEITLAGSLATTDLHVVATRRIFGNLIENGCRAAGPRGTVAVTVSGSESATEVEVADSGPGLDVGALPPVLASVIAIGTASVGLRIVERLVREAGGSTMIRQSTLGGASVVVRLPAGRRVPSRPGAADESGLA